MANYTIVNGTDSQLTNVNVGGVDIPKRSVRDGVTLTDAELAALCVQAGVACLKDAALMIDKRSIARQLRYRKASVGNTSGT